MQDRVSELKQRYATLSVVKSSGFDMLQMVGDVF